MEAKDIVMNDGKLGKVVEWVEQSGIPYESALDDWQAKLKEWRIERDN